MKSETIFGKPISYSPWIHALLISLLFALIGWVIFNSPVGTILGILVFLLIMFGYYPYYLPQLYGAWKINQQELSFYNLKRYSQRLQLLLQPRMAMTTREVSAIKAVQIFRRKEVKDSSDILALSLTGYTPELYLPWMRKPYYAVVEFKDGEKVALDFSWNVQFEKNVDELQNAIQFLNGLN